MEPISYDAFDALFASFRLEALHLEMRDAYGTEVELPHLAKWLKGEPDDPVWLEPWFERVRAGTAAGKAFRRARIVSELFWRFLVPLQAVREKFPYWQQVVTDG